MFKYDGYEVTFMALANREPREAILFPTLAEAMSFCEDTLGNRAWAKPFPGEDTYLYGPGNGDTSMTVSRHIVGFADKT